MEINTEQKDNCTVLSLTGRLDASVAEEFKQTVQTHLDLKTVHFVVDLGGVDYMDSGGLGSLVASLRRVREQEGDIKISSLNSTVRKVFELTRVHRIFDIYDDIEAAEQTFQAA